MKKTLLFGLFMLFTIAAISQSIQSQGLPFTITPVKANINDIILKVQRGELTEVPVSYTPRKKTGYPDDMPLPADAKIIPFVGNNLQIPNPGLPNAVSPAPTSNFTGIIDNKSTIPPDVQGAVGPSHVFTVLNNLYRFQNRTGSVISTISPSTFWAPTGISGVFDPNIVYDPYNNRWIFCVTASAQSPNSALLVAVSQTADPTGSWNFYAIDADANNQTWIDYPSLGFNKDWITISGNIFTNYKNDFAGVQIYVFDKATMYAGGTINNTNTTLFTGNNVGGTITPAFTYDNSLAKQYLLQNWNSSLAIWRMYEITGTTHPLTSTAPGFPTNSSAWSFAAVAGPQSGVAASQYLDAGDVRMQSVVYRNGKLWGTQSISLPSTSPTRNAVQAWQINPTDLVVDQSIRIDDNTSTQHYYYPSIAVNANDDVLLGFAQSSASSFASSSYALRLGTDAAGTINTPYTYKAGLAKYFKTYSGTRNRWGDYTSTVVDPTNDIDFWTLQEYAETPSGGVDLWGTHWAKLCIIPDGRLYVNKNATGTNNGMSWENAFTDLQSALAVSCPMVTEIWVAKGTYMPALANGDKNLSFTIRDNLKVYGGFAGTELLLTDRNYSLIHTTNNTILSGDLNGNDGANFANITENSDAVVRMSNVTSTTRLDGFSISGGNNTVATVFGGGISLVSSSPIIANCSIIGNHTDFRGGGISNALGQPSIENCSFLRNRASSHGGAMYNLSNSGTTQTINISNSIFVGNSVVTNSGSILFNFSFAGSGTTQNVNLTNCSFSENTSPNHGIYNLVEVTGSAINTNLKNCVFFNNGGNKTIFNQPSGGTSTTTANNSFFQTSVTNFTGSNNIISDISPFVSTTDLHLPCGSLAIDSGTSAGVSATDLDGNPRPLAGTGVDIGAYEYQGVPPPMAVAVSPNDICSGTIVTMTANCTMGLPEWYDQPTGGNLVGNGITLSKSPSVNTTYYVNCKNGTCKSIRTATNQVLVATPSVMLNLTSDFIANTTQIANTTISAINKIINPAKVLYKAGNSVTLNGGFEAKNGSTFEAKIGGCENVTIPGLVAYYPFNGNANDESTNNNNGVVNGATLTTDRFGDANKAYAFDGVNDRINANVGAEMYSAEKTISVWAMVSGAGSFNPRLVGVGPYGSSLQYYSLLLEGLTSPRRLWFFTSDAVSQAPIHWFKIVHYGTTIL